MNFCLLFSVLRGDEKEDTFKQENDARSKIEEHFKTTLANIQK